MIRKINSANVILLNISIILPILLSTLGLFILEINKEILVGFSLILSIVAVNSYGVYQYFYNKKSRSIILANLLLLFGIDLGGFKYIPNLLFEISVQYYFSNDVSFNLFVNTPSITINTRIEEVIPVFMSINIYVLMHLILLVYEHKSSSSHKSAT